MTGKYESFRHPSYSELTISECYLCRKTLDGRESPDHIIPNTFFKGVTDGTQFKPKLPVHYECNNKKSIDDEWFRRITQLRSPENPDAVADFIDFINKAKLESQNAFLIGKSKHLRNYKLAKSLTGPVVWGLQVKTGNEIMYEFNTGEANTQRMSLYLKSLTRGLFIRNVPGSNPGTPKLHTIQYRRASLTGKGNNILESVQQLISQSSATLFTQQWGDRVSYMGSHVGESIDKGWIYVHFYQQTGTLAFFT